MTDVFELGPLYCAFILHKPTHFALPPSRPVRCFPCSARSFSLSHDTLPAAYLMNVRSMSQVFPVELSEMSPACKKTVTDLISKWKKHVSTHTRRTGSGGSVAEDTSELKETGNALKLGGVKFLESVDASLLSLTKAARTRADPK